MESPSLMPAVFFQNPDQERFQDSYRRWQGVPSIEVTDKGRIFVNLYSGQDAEVSGNFLVLSISDDQGETFQKTVVVEHPHEKVRIFDPNLWMDPDKRLWMTWSQSYEFNDGRFGVWISICDNPDAESPEWSDPRRISNGIMMNKPIVTSDDEWLFPCAIWNNFCGTIPSEDHGLQNEQFSNVYVSTDKGQTFHLRGGADVPNRSFDEHMVVEKEDKSLWMLVRTFDGIGESFSVDGGYTWSKGKNSHIDGPCSRFHIRRLESGKLLMINHEDFTDRIDKEEILNQGDVKSWKGRSHLTAFLSEDDGKTWPFTLLLDERDDVSYPDATESKDGTIYVTYDWDRVKQREILISRFKEEDIIKGECVTEDAFLKRLVNKATGMPDIH